MEKFVFTHRRIVNLKRANCGQGIREKKKREIEPLFNRVVRELKSIVSPVESEIR